MHIILFIFSLSVVSSWACTQQAADEMMDSQINRRRTPNSYHSCNNGTGDILFVGVLVNSIHASYLPVENLIGGACINRQSHQVYWAKYALATREKCNEEEAYNWKNRFMEYVEVEYIYKKAEDEYVMTQLADKCDFDEDLLKSATFSYINTTPLNKTLAEGNWKKLGDQLRDSIKKGEFLSNMIVGTRGNVKYLGNRISVPEVIFKVVILKGKQRGLVYFGVNDEKHKPFCEKLDDCGFTPDPEKGTIYCCELTDELGKMLDLADPSASTPAN